MKENNDRTEKRVTHSEAQLRKEAAKIRSLQKQVVGLWIFFGIVVLGTIIGLVRVYQIKHRATPLDTMAIVDENINFRVTSSPDEMGGYNSMKECVEANYLRYLNMAYILIGQYPECEYIKISPNVTRNEYNWSEDFYVGEGQLYYNYYKDGAAQGKVGIDVSEFQKTIDWEKVKGAGVDIAMIRLAYRGYGTGEIHDDTKAAENLQGANAAGLDTGVYFFSAAINREEGVEEANYVLEHIKGHKINQPIVIDTEYIFEDKEARTNNISVEDRTAAVVGFCETIEAAGYTPMIYASRDQFVKYLDIDAIGKYEFWLAAYDTPVFPYHTEGYQYTPYGYVDGIDTQVDLNVWMR